MRNITTHIIHCSDSSFGDAAIIRKWHLARGWRDIGYHFVIRSDGEIEIGRTLECIGAHCKGNNSNSIGTCLIGKESFQQEQFAALKRLNNMLTQIFPDLIVMPHNHFNQNKTCPNFDISKILST